ncbi:ATP-binding protein [Cerasicoccus arenae]|uniref:Histidine kinase domain-containing protein n=1 Tax=Cerasicoccus arenae TaxID=424488 RepID=A0A8J3DIG2_9BACT|nr:ATP-binding protein [Cerasicoccus arenae]MBK1858570.1 hypothetical protein [Cerasicoccus arenae]GHC06360.1 hypothetical protein GCM10007047_24360 [Cerasicoccus arenae]
MNPGISIWNRLLGVMVVMLAIIGVLLLWQSRSDWAASEKLLRSVAASRHVSLYSTSRMISRSLESFAYEYSRDTLQGLPANDDIVHAARDAKVDFFAVLRPDLSVAFAREFKNKLAPEALIPSPSILRYLANEGEDALFFSTSVGGGPLQCAFAPLKSDNDQPTGYLICGRYWDRVYMTSLGESTGATLQAFPVTEINAHPPGFINSSREYRATEVGLGAMGQPVFAYTATFDLSAEQVILRQRREAMNRIAFGVLGILVLFFAVLWKWLAYPVRLVSEALEKDDPTVLKPILNEDYDWSRIAQRLTESTEARLELTREVHRQQEQARIQEETALVRETLARDLHDGVIQSVYAVGLQLERANAMAQRDPAKTMDRINDCKDTLNSIIRELRGFIKGLTPAPLQGQSLHNALEQLVIHARKSTDTAIDIRINPGACLALTTAQALHIYQLSRELLSNAIRHAEAKNIVLRLSHEPDAVELSIVDDGVGFDHEDLRLEGRGLANIQDRARQMSAYVKIMSRPSTGTRVHIKVPIIDKP